MQGRMMMSGIWKMKNTPFSFLLIYGLLMTTKKTDNECYSVNSK